MRRFQVRWAASASRGAPRRFLARLAVEGVAKAVNRPDERGPVAAERAAHLGGQRAEGRVRHERVGPEAVPDFLLRDRGGAALHEQLQQLEGMGLQSLGHVPLAQLARGAVENEGTELNAHDRPSDPGEPSTGMLGRGTLCRNDSAGRSAETGISQGMRRDSSLSAPYL